VAVKPKRREYLQLLLSKKLSLLAIQPLADYCKALYCLPQQMDPELVQQKLEQTDMTAVRALLDTIEEFNRRTA
jgi:hypothetical protein